MADRPSHPLTARVAVNRWWQLYFGTGIVETVEGFGSQGAWPSHPELLDWLATEFIRTGWNVKEMQRLIVTSATYRQASRVSPALRERDPNNRFFARGPRFRLAAETVRDNALVLSGLLRDRIGGPSVKPYQPDGLWQDVSVERRAVYKQDEGDGLYRRSMYTFWKRTCPPPGMMTFDAPDRETCTIRRARTNTPLQALVLMNDPTYLEASRKLAERVLTGGHEKDEVLLTRLYHLVLCRDPQVAESATLLPLLAKVRKRFQAVPEKAEQLLKVGSSRRDEKVEAAELAAWTTLCSLVLNLDETITKEREMQPLQDFSAMLTRRHFFGKSASAIGTAALALLAPARGEDSQKDPPSKVAARVGGLAGIPHFAPRAKRVIYLFQSGGPSQIELFDDKPLLREKHGSELPDSVRRGQRLTGMTSGQKSFPVIAPKFKFVRHGGCGMQVGELLPHTGKIADDICLVRSLHTEAINHDPAITFIQTGSQQPGRPSFGAWAAYGLGTEAADLPSFVVMISHGSGKDSNQGLLDRLWGSGFLPSNHQAVKLRSQGDAVLYLSDSPGIDRDLRQEMLDGLARLNEQKLRDSGDPEIATRIAQFELAFRMQTSVPELTDLTGEPQAIFDLYGPDVKKPGSFAANCLLARRLVERGVRFVQLYHRGWDQHNNLPDNMPLQCRDVDRPQAALIQDLKQRGLLDETLVIWGGEFGRTVYGQGGLKESYGRDHHGRCFSMWMAGGGIKPGLVYGATDDFSYNITENPVHIHDLNATLLHCLGIEHERLTFRQQGRDYRLTDVHGTVIKDILT